MNVRDILKGKTAGSAVLTVAPDMPAVEAARLLMSHRIGSVIVVENGSIVGILTERDIVRCMVEKGNVCSTLTVDKVMTPDPVSCRESDSVNKVMQVMSSKRFRHMPVVDNANQLIGVLSIGDVLKSKTEEAEHKADDMEAMVGFVPDRE